ncbi:MAG: YHS domain-containing (seleno)protein [Nevskia sp.]
MKKLTRSLCRSIFVVTALAFAHSAQAASPVYAPGGVAIKGYDTVAYFLDGKPVKGNDSFTTTYMGATWKFASKDHLDKFKAEPVKYAPQYGGYCAYGTSQGHLAPTIPEAWMVVDNKLYLNYNLAVRNTWNKDIRGYNKSADTQFPQLLAGPAEAE